MTESCWNLDGPDVTVTAGWHCTKLTVGFQAVHGKIKGTAWTFGSAIATIDASFAVDDVLICLNVSSLGTIDAGTLYADSRWPRTSEISYCKARLAPTDLIASFGVS